MSPFGDDNGFYGRKLVVVVNKVWEADPLEGVLAARPSAVSQAFRPKPDSVQFVRAQKTKGMRGYVIANADLRTEVWCIEEMMPAGSDKSSSLEKSKVLLPLLSDPKVRLVIATGTAASSPELAHWGSSQNGCVVLGRNVFVHDGNPLGDPSKHWSPPTADKILESALSGNDFAQLLPDPQFSVAVEPRMLKLPNDPAETIAPLINPEYVALSDVNVTDPTMYATADKATFDAFKALNRSEPAGALDTTLGVVRSCVDSNVPFMFVAGIVNRAYHFADEVLPRPYAQNFVGAHNAGISIAFMLPTLASHAWPS